MNRFSPFPTLAIVTVLYAALATACNDSIEPNQNSGSSNEISAAGTDSPKPKSDGDAVVTLTEANFEAEASKGVVLVDFWAAWCGPCRMIAPLVEEVATEFAGRAVIAKVDVDANPGLAQKFNISSIPNLKILKDGKVMDGMVGVVPKEEIVRKLNAQL